MIRRIIQIEEEKCNGCGACAKACHEGAIGMVNGKAKLLRDDYCDGLGDCLPTCPTGAITFVEREAAAYDEAAVLAAKEKHSCPSGGCPGAQAKALKQKQEQQPSVRLESQLRQWPVQIKLAPMQAPWFHGADLLVAADCTAYAYANFHQDFIKDRVTLVGCPKLDSIDYSMKLFRILENNDIRSVTVVRMEVPCCGGIEYAVKKAVEDSGKDIPCNVIVISVDGQVVSDSRS